MAADLTLQRALPATARLPFLRWCALGLLLAVEVVALTVRFDGEMLARHSGLWARLVGLAHHLPYLAVAIGTALVLFAGKGLTQQLRLSAAAIQQRPHNFRYLAAHLTALAVFGRLTAVLLEGDPGALGRPALCAFAWFVAGTATFVFWCLVALPAAVWRRLARHSLLALTAGAVVGIAAWVVGRGAANLLDFLSDTTFALVHHILALVFIDVYCDPAQALLGTPTFYVYIAPECSGYEGIGLVGVFLGVYLWYFRRRLRFPQALVLLPLGAIVMYMANALRIASLVAVGTYLSPQVALGGFHSQAGWLAFNAVALGIVFLTRQLDLFSRPEGEPADIPEVNSSAAFVVPLLALVGMTMISTAFSSGFDYLYPVRVLVVGAVLWHFRAAYAQLFHGWSWFAALLGAAVFIVWLFLEPLANPSAAAGLIQGLSGLSPGWALAWLGFRVCGSVMVVPIAEELAFRGYLIRRLQAPAFDLVPTTRFTWASLTISSVLFGLLHGRWFAGTVAGLAYAAAVQRRGRLGDAVLAHAVTNALIAVHVLTTGAWSLWV